MLSGVDLLLHNRYLKIWASICVYVRLGDVMGVCDGVYREVKLQGEIMGEVIPAIRNYSNNERIIRKYVSGKYNSGKYMPINRCNDIESVIKEMDFVWACFRDYVHDAITRLPIGPYSSSKQNISYAPLLDSVEQLDKSYGRVRDLLPEIVQKTGKEIEMGSDLGSPLCTIVTSLENLSKKQDKYIPVEA